VGIEAAVEPSPEPEFPVEPEPAFELELLLEQAAAEPRASAPIAAAVIVRLNICGFLSWLSS
jgi:hypothetical protein